MNINLITLQMTPQELDYIVQRMTAGQMDYPTAMNTNSLLLKMQKQANDADIQSLATPAPPVHPLSHTPNEVRHASNGSDPG